MDSDSKDGGHEMVYDHEYTEAGNDDLKPRSNKMKEVVSRMNKGIKVTKGKPNQNNPKITKKNTPNKIKSEIPKTYICHKMCENVTLYGEIVSWWLS